MKSPCMYFFSFLNPYILPPAWRVPSDAQCTTHHNVYTLYRLAKLSNKCRLKEVKNISPVLDSLVKISNGVLVVCIHSNHLPWI